MEQRYVLGVDGCRAGWIAIAFKQHTLKPLLLKTKVDLLSELQKAKLVYLDIPIGLSDSEASRPCDRLLRQALGPFRSSVFNPPIRTAVYADSYQEACARNAAATGKKLSKQSWNIVPKIRMMDELLQDNPSMTNTVLESHPELVFRMLNGDRSLDHKKKTAEGREERLRILESYIPSVSLQFAEVRSQFLKKQMSDDDIVDAIGLAIAASRAIRNGIRCLPEAPDRDETGLRMAIHY